jgi:hypothetical protein
VTNKAGKPGDRGGARSSEAPGESDLRENRTHSGSSGSSIFKPGDRVYFSVIHPNHSAGLRSHVGERGTVRSKGHDGKLLVKFDRTDEAFGEWWIGPEYLLKVAPIPDAEDTFAAMDKMYAKLKFDPLPPGAMDEKSIWVGDDHLTPREFMEKYHQCED